MVTIKSESGRSKDVRRIYHADTRAIIHFNDPRPSMRAWARRYVSIARAGTVGDGTLASVALVAQWLNGKGVRA